MESDPSSSDSSSRKYDSFDDRKFSKSKSKKHNKKNNNRKRMKQDLSDSSSSNSDFSEKIDYKIKICDKKKRYRKRYPIKLCANSSEKFLTTGYKSKTIRFKLDKDLLHYQIYFITFTESLEMIFSKYKETCEVLLDYTKIGGGDIKYYF